MPCLHYRGAGGRQLNPFVVLQFAGQQAVQTVPLPQRREIIAARPAADTNHPHRTGAGGKPRAAAEALLYIRGKPFGRHAFGQFADAAQAVPRHRGQGQVQPVGQQVVDTTRRAVQISVGARCV